MRADFINVKILLVEDHQDTRTGLALLFQKWGHTIFPAETLAEAMELLGRVRIDVLVCDFGLPDGNGLDVVAKAKKLDPSTKAIALTARGSDDDYKVGFETGVDHYLVKPPDFGELRRLLDQ